MNERMQAIYQKAQTRLGELVWLSESQPQNEWLFALACGISQLTFHFDTHQIDENSTLPCTVSSVQVTNAPHTRRGFLGHSLSPLLSANKDRPYTLSEALREISATADKLGRFGMGPWENHMVPEGVH